MVKRETPTSFSSDDIQIIWDAAIGMDRNLVSVLDLATVGCFLALQEMQLDPMNMQHPAGERRVSGQPTQSASKTIKIGRTLRDKMNAIVNCSFNIS